MLRLFTGLRLPPELCRQLNLLPGGIIGAKWTRTEDYHITLTFIGEVDEVIAEDIDEALAGIRMPRFDLSLKGTGVFSRGAQSSHLWAGVASCDALRRLQEKSDHALEKLRLPIEKLKYTPHVTLARLKHAGEPEVAGFIQQHSLFTSAPFAVDEFILYQSHLGKGGASYEELRAYPLSYAAVPQIS